MLVIEAGDDAVGAVGRLSFMHLMLATCYGTNMPDGYRPEILSARVSADRWRALTTTIDKFNREFCWPRYRIHPASTLWSAGHAPPSNKEMNMCVWVVAWMFMCGRKGMKHASDSEKLAAISVGGVLQLPRFGVLGMHDRNFNISPDWGLNSINSGSKVCISTIGGRHEGYQLVTLQRSAVVPAAEKKKKEHQLAPLPPPSLTHNLTKETAMNKAHVGTASTDTFEIQAAQFPSAQGGVITSDVVQESCPKPGMRVPTSVLGPCPAALEGSQVSSFSHSSSVSSQTPLPGHPDMMDSKENTAPVSNGSFMPNNCQGMVPQNGGMVMMTGARLLLLMLLSSLYITPQGCTAQ